MVLYALCLHPFLNFLNRKIAGIKIGNRTRPTAIVAYVDDVTIFITTAANLVIVEDAINIFEQAAGARLTPRKSKALAIGGWNTTDTIRGIEYYQSVTILGVTFWATTRQTMDDTWERLTGKSAWKRRKPMTRTLALHTGCAMPTSACYPNCGI